MLVTRLIPNLIEFFSRVEKNRLPEPLKERHKEGCAAFTRPDSGKQLSAHRCNNTDKSARLKSSRGVPSLPGAIL